MNDHELLNQFLTQNSQPAFRALVERHTNWLYSVCLRRLRDPSLAEDATQAVFLALAQKASSLRHEKTLSPWLHQVAKFIAANILRAKARRAHHESEAAAMTPTITPAPDWSKIESHLEPALDRLPFADRQILLLRFYEQKSHPQIAATLSISEPAAAKRLSRALDRLRQILSPKSASLSSAGLTSLLLSHAITTAPAHLAAAATISTTTATLAKGALTAMAISKLQTAALVIAACLLIAVPTTLIVVHHKASAPSQPLAEPTPAPAVSAPLDPFAQVYAPAPGQLLKHITDAPPELRNAFIHDKITPNPPTLGSLYFGWNGNTLSNYRYDNATRYNLSSLAQKLLDLQPEEIEGNLAKHTITGDFSYDQSSSVTPDQYCAALQKILQDELNLPVSIQFRNVPRKVIVLHGHWKLSPVPTIPTSDSPTGPNGAILPCIDIYGGDQFDPNSLTSGNGSGDARRISGELAYWIHQNQQVLIEADNFPKLLGFRLHNPPGELGNADTPSHNRDQVLNHLSEQTGLTWSEETRTVRRLFIESAPASLDPFTQTYGLEPGQLFKRVTDAPPEVRDPFIRQKFSTSPRSPASIFIGWSNGTLATYSYRGGRGGYPLTQIVSYAFSINSFEIESSVPPADLTGDFVYRVGASPADQCIAMQQFLKQEFNIDAALHFRDVPRKVIVLRGQWQFIPTTTDPLRNPPTGPDGAPLPSIFLYSTAAFDKTKLAQTSSGSASDPRDLANSIAWWLNQQVIIEAQNLPPSIGYRGFSIRAKDDILTPQDKIAALNHLTQQTHLTWSEETRTVRRLFIESPK